MFQKKLSALSPESVKYQAAHVFLQWISLLATIGFTAIFTGILGKAQERSLSFRDTGTALAAVAAIIIIKFLSAIFQEYFSFKSSETVKATLRNRIFSKLRRLGASYKERISSAEVVQLTGEGVDQLETYFGAYIPQLFYSILAPLTLFVFFTPVDALCAAVLFVCVPLIPLTIALVQTFAKRLLSKYWGQYGDLGNTFLENLQGMTTLKIYRTDGLRNEVMNQEAEKFRRITMKVLTMQLNSIFVMDFIAYGGAGTGIILALLRLQSGALDFSGCLMFILLSADFFIPMRRLGSFFHIAMNGIAAGEKILRLLGLPEPEEGTEPGTAFAGARISAEGLFFSYDGKRTVLKNVAFTVDGGSLTAIVGESGSGKSTIAALLAGRIRGYDGSITVRGCELSSIKETELLKNTCTPGRKVICSRERFKTTCAPSVPAPRKRNCGKRWKKSASPPFSGKRRGCRQSSRRVRPICPAGSGSGLPWRGRFCLTAPCTSLTKRPRTSTRKAKRKSSTAYTGSPVKKPSC